MATCLLRVESIGLIAIVLNLTQQLQVLLLAIKAAYRVFRLFAVEISFVSADHAPAKLTTFDTLLILNTY